MGRILDPLYGSRQLNQLGHCCFQTRPLMVKTGQYPNADRNDRETRTFDGWAERQADVSDPDWSPPLADHGSISLAFAATMSLSPVSVLKRITDSSRTSCRVRNVPTCGRLRVGKDFLHVCSIGRVRPCVRPVDAVHMTAGHNALRGSGPGQKPAFDNALAQVGCPDRRIDRLCITCCCPPNLHITPDVRRDLVYAASATGCL
jgi:hypothetical protein